jgi:UDP-galactopyranose mutase
MRARYDVICLSHLRWDFVWQRPQHLLSRCAQRHRVFFVEEPIIGEPRARIDVTPRDCGILVAVPHLPAGLDERETALAQRTLIDDMRAKYGVDEAVVWYYTPMALPFSRHLPRLATVYDCMDELSAFMGAPPTLVQHESELIQQADLVFTGGASLYESKQTRRPDVHLFPSSVDAAHFAQARKVCPDPSDQAAIGSPRLGFFGVIDERMDLDLIATIADARPEWQLVMVGPVVKIDPTTLPRRPNIHYLGSKRYEELPTYLAGWDVALLTFARNDATRFISPTKTLEYLAAGKPVVSTPIRDVVQPYGEQNLVRIADTPEEFVAAVDELLCAETSDWSSRVDAFLAQTSWDRTWARMCELIDAAVASQRPRREGLARV